MRRRLALAIALAAVPLTFGLVTLTPASADPPVVFEPEGTAHTHHVHTGAGECVEIDSVLFLAVEHGLHHGAGLSGSLVGPWHGTCSGVLYPGSTIPAPPHPGH